MDRVFRSVRLQTGRPSLRAFRINVVSKYCLICLADGVHALIRMWDSPKPYQPKTRLSVILIKAREVRVNYYKQIS